MSCGLKITGFVIFFWISFAASSQVDKALIPYSNKLLLNPSYAGFNKNTHVWSGMQFAAYPEKNLNNTLSVTYDTWLEKMDGGFSLQLYQGLIGDLNINTVGAGFAFSKPFPLGKNGQLIPSIGLNHHIASKQWFVHFIDRMIDKSFEFQSPPGEEFLRYSASQPMAGLLWNTVSAEIGLTGFWSFYQDFDVEQDILEPNSLILVFHATKKSRGNRRGLVSKPVKTSPEITFLYGENLLISRIGIRIEESNSLMGLFIQNNYTENYHGIGGVLGIKFNNFQINLSAGGNYSISQRKTGFFGEASLGLSIPYAHINEKNPWAPPRRSF